MAGDIVGRCLIFWDYDTQWGIDRWRGPGQPGTDLGSLEFELTDRLLQLHTDYAVPACFAVVGAAALPGDAPYHNPAQIRRIHAAGHEVGSHSFRHDWLPALGPVGLRDTLRRSKDALEQCIGARVQSFVLPFNQPFDYPSGLSFSLSERREAGRERSDLRDVCRALNETGYSFCRVSYRAISARLVDWVLGRPAERPARVETIEGVSCVRLNTQGGFGADALSMLNRCATDGGLVIVYGHPHSLRSGNAQDETMLVPFLKELRRHVTAGSIRVCLPRELAGTA